MILLAIRPFSLNLIDDVREILGYDFMRDAFLAGSCIALAAGLVGYFVVLRNQVFTSDALGHAAFAGGLGGLLLGFNLLVGVFGSTIAVALGMGALGGRARGRDVAIGTVFAWLLGLGALFLSVYTSGRSSANGTVGVSVLFGSIVGLETTRAAVTAVTGLATAIVLLAIGRPLLLSSLDPDVAIARGVPTRVVAAIFLVLLAVTVAESVQAVGALLIFCLMVTPAAVAQKLTARPYPAIALSAVFAIAFVWLGLALAFYIPYPTSFFITGVAFATFLLVVLLKRLRPTRA